MIPSPACQLSPADTPGPRRRAAKTYTTPGDTITDVSELITARERMARFHAMMRSKDPARLDAWIASAKDSKLAAFANGVQADRGAVTAAIAKPWSRADSVQSGS